MKISKLAASSSMASPRDGPPSWPASRPCWKPATRWRFLRPRSLSRGCNEDRQLQAIDRLLDLYRVDPRESLGGVDECGVQPEIFFRQCGGGRFENRRCVHRAHAGWFAAHQWRGDRMRPTAQAQGHLQRQLAGADREAPPHAGDLRDRARRRRRAADLDRGARPPDQRRHPRRRPSGLARDPVEPEEFAGDRRSARDQDGAAEADAGGAEENGDCDVVTVATTPVVPAKAGTHTPRQMLLEKEEQPAVREITNVCGYGSLLSQGRRC